MKPQQVCNPRLLKEVGVGGRRRIGGMVCPVADEVGYISCAC